MPDQNCDHGSRYNRRIRRIRFDPSDVELLPGNECRSRTRELGRAATDRDRQFVDADFIAAVRWLIDRHDIEGVVNLAAPNPLPYAEFMQELRDSCGIRFGLPSTTWMVEVGAFVMRTETELILKSRRVVPGRLLEHGFVFKYPLWRDAARELCGRSRSADINRVEGPC